ncbi:MAG: sugar phosphate nucleotidyltransferase [Chloroflexota bacterium]
MYAVILAGGGGTRLHPLSRPERPKPFLPLLGERSLLQGTVDRLSGLTDDITVVTDRRYRDIVLEQAPGVAVVVEPLGRNTAAAIALATLVIERPDAEVMVVLPADQTVERTDVFREVLRTAADHLATGAFGIEHPLVTLGIQVDRAATEYGYLIPDLARGADIEGLMAYPLTRFEEKPKPARAEELRKQAGVAWNAGIFLWRREAIGRALTKYTGLLQSLGPMVGSPTSLQDAYEAIQRPVSIDYAVMEGAAQSGHVVMASMDVGWSDLGSWSALLTALGARGSGAVVQAGETVEVEHDDLIVRRVGGRLGVIAPPERGRMTATQPIAVLRGTSADRALIEGLLERCSGPED